MHNRTPSKRRRSIKPSNWPHLLTGYRLTSALIKCVDAIKVERASLLYVHSGIEKKIENNDERKERGEGKFDTDCPISVSDLTLRRTLLSSIIWSRGERPRQLDN